MYTTSKKGRALRRPARFNNQEGAREGRGRVHHRQAARGADGEVSALRRAPILYSMTAHERRRSCA
jgi:hypothetical protein